MMLTEYHLSAPRVPNMMLAAAPCRESHRRPFLAPYAGTDVAHRLFYTYRTRRVPPGYQFVLHSATSHAIWLAGALGWSTGRNSNVCISPARRRVRTPVLKIRAKSDTAASVGTSSLRLTRTTSANGSARMTSATTAAPVGLYSRTTRASSRSAFFTALTMTLAGATWTK